MPMHKQAIRGVFIALGALAIAGCGNGGGGGGNAATPAPVAVTKLAGDTIASSTSETTVPISINALRFSNTLDRSETADPIPVD